MKKDLPGILVNCNNGGDKISDACADACADACILETSTADMPSMVMRLSYESFMS